MTDYLLAWGWEVGYSKEECKVGSCTLEEQFNRPSLGYGTHLEHFPTLLDAYLGFTKKWEQGVVIVIGVNNCVHEVSFFWWISSGAHCSEAWC